MNGANSEYKFKEGGDLLIGTEMDEIRVQKFTVGLEGKAFPKRRSRGDAAVHVQRLCAQLSKLSLFSPHAQDLR